MTQTRWRAAAFRVIALCLVVAAVEAASRVAYRIAFGRAYVRGELSDLGHDASYAPRQWRDAPHLNNLGLHPYFGFANVGNPHALSRHGFLFGDLPEAPVGNDTLSVLVTGGSVAIQLGRQIDAALNERLRDVGRRARRARVFTAALGGFKQPQQLMALNYFLVLGFSFDLVVNIDGYNEIVLPSVENVPRGVFPAFPRRWDYRFRAIQNIDELTRLGEVAFLERRKESLVRLDRESPWSSLAAIGFVTAYRFVRADREILRVTAEALSERSELSFEAKGPPFEAKDPRDVLEFSVDVWARSSELMAALARERGMLYVHVLQPNQHHDGAKPLSREETEMFYRAGSAQEEAVRTGYPLMLGRSRTFPAAGVDFVDATRLFESERRTVYRDLCCHFNALGLELLSDFITERLIERLP